MTMTFLSQQQYVSRALQDTGNVTWAAQLVKDLLNQGFQDVARRTRALKRFVAFVPDPSTTEAGLYVPDYQYALDEVLVLQRSAFFPLRKVTLQQAIGIDTTFDTTTADTPSWYIPNEYKQGTVKVFPAPDASTGTLTDLRGLITFVHPTLTVDADTCLLHPAYHVLPCFYAIAEAHATNNEAQDESKDGSWLSRYERGVTEYIAQIARNFDAAPATQPKRNY